MKTSSTTSFQKEQQAYQNMQSCHKKLKIIKLNRTKIGLEVLGPTTSLS